MLEPWDLQYGPQFDVFNPDLDVLCKTETLAFVRLVCPCSSFSSLCNLDTNGPLRPRNNPYGESHPDALLGNRLWNRTPFLARLLLTRGVGIASSHPRGSRAWCWNETEKLIKDLDLAVVENDWCMYPSEPISLERCKKPTRIVTSLPWIKACSRVCTLPADHTHGGKLRGLRAKAAVAYPLAYCQAMAVSCAEFQGIHDKAEGPEA